MRKIHEHIIRMPAFVAKDALWNGIVEAMRHPDQYIDHMVDVAVLKEEKNGQFVTMTREIDFGQFRLQDKVELEQGKTARTLVAQGPTWPASSFLIKLEEPEEGHLFVRFLYEDDSSDVGENPMVLELRRQAYEAKDRGMIEYILQSIAVAEAS